LPVAGCRLPVAGSLFPVPCSLFPGRGGRDPSAGSARRRAWRRRSEEHTSELQSRFDLVCRLLLEKKKQSKCVGQLGGESGGAVGGAWARRELGGVPVLPGGTVLRRSLDALRHC